MEVEILTMEQGTPEWFAARRGVVSSSKFKDVMTKGRGNAPSKTRETYMKELACERVTGIVQEGFTNEHMERGNLLEPRARAMFQLDRGLKVEEVGFIRTVCGNLGTSTDGLIGENAVLEIKCPKNTTHFSYWLDPDSLYRAYKAQVQGEMYITGRDICYLMSFHPEFNDGKDLLVLEVERDAGYQDELANELELFVDQLEDMVKVFKRQKMS